MNSVPVSLRFLWIANLLPVVALAGPYLPALSSTDTSVAANRPASYYRMGSACFVAGRYGEAARWFEKACAHGKDPLYTVCQSRALFETGESEKSRFLLNNVIIGETGSGQALASYQLGEQYLRQNQFSRALDAFKRSVGDTADCPWIAPAYVGMYVSAINLGFSGQAHLYLQKVRTQFPRLLEQKYLDNVLGRPYQFAPVDFADAMERAEPPVSQPQSEPGPPTPQIEETAADAAAGYTVQTGSFGVRENAVNMYDALSPALPGVRLEEASVNGKTYYRIRVGSFASREEAQEFADRTVRPLVSTCKVIAE